MKNNKRLVDAKTGVSAKRLCLSADEIRQEELEGTLIPYSKFHQRGLVDAKTGKPVEKGLSADEISQRKLDGTLIAYSAFLKRKLVDAKTGKPVEKGLSADEISQRKLEGTLIAYSAFQKRRWVDAKKRKSVDSSGPSSRKNKRWQKASGNIYSPNSPGFWATPPCSLNPVSFCGSSQEASLPELTVSEFDFDFYNGSNIASYSICPVEGVQTNISEIGLSPENNGLSQTSARMIEPYQAMDEASESVTYLEDFFEPSSIETSRNRDEPLRNTDSSNYPGFWATPSYLSGKWLSSVNEQGDDSLALNTEGPEAKSSVNDEVLNTPPHSPLRF